MGDHSPVVDGNVGAPSGADDWRTEVDSFHIPGAFGEDEPESDDDEVFLDAATDRASSLDPGVAAFLLKLRVAV